MPPGPERTTLIAMLEGSGLNLTNRYKGLRQAVRTERIRRNVWAELRVPWKGQDDDGYMRLITHRMMMDFNRQSAGEEEKESPTKLA